MAKYAKAYFEELLLKEFDFIQRRMNNVAFAEKFREHCLIENSTVDDYLLKSFALNDVEIIAGIRFMNRDIGYPFVEIEYYSGSKHEFFAQFEDVKSLLKIEFQLFKPLQLAMIIKSEDIHWVQEIPHQLDRHWYSISLDYMYEKHISFPEVRVEKIDGLSDEDYQIYKEQYAHFNQKHPDLTFVFAEPQQTINQHCKSGLGCKLYVNDDWAGFALFAKGYPEFYLDGYLVWDKIIFEKYQGKNLSAILQNMAFQQFVPRQKGFLYGTIDAKNIGSIKTAEKSGRERVMSSCFWEF